MSPEQRQALERVAGRALTDAEVTQIDALLPARNDVAIAETLTAGQPRRRVSIAVEDVFNILYAAGDYAVLKQAQMSGDPLASLAFAFLTDAKILGPGRVDLDAEPTVAQFDVLQDAGLLSQAGRDALDAAGWVDAGPVAVHVVSEALNNG